MSATAANYVGHVRWASADSREGLRWRDATIGSILKGKKDLRTRLAEWPERLRIHETDIHRLVALASNLGDTECGVLALGSDHLLLQMADEAMPLEIDVAADEVGRLPEGRHSGVWIEDDETRVNLRSRKHRPQGSLRQGPATAVMAETTDFALIVACHCRQLKWAAKFSQG